MKRKSGGKSRVIWWAVDPFHDDEAFQKNALRVLRPFAKALNASIVPVAYLDAYRGLEQDGYRFPLLPLFNEPHLGLRAIAEARFTKMRSREIDRLLSAPVLLTHDIGKAPSLREKVGAIIKGAKRSGALFVALQSHSRRGLKRLYMGSFAETFILYSDVPTLTINPQTSCSDKIQRILFPTDFSRESLTALEKVLHLAAMLSARVMVVHYLSVLSPPDFLKRGTIEQLKKEQKQRDLSFQRHGAKLVGKGKKLGVNTSFHIIRDTVVFDPSGALLRFAKAQRADLIALAAQSRSVETELLGAMSRQIVRDAPCPVLIYRK